MAELHKRSERIEEALIVRCGAVSLRGQWHWVRYYLIGALARTVVFYFQTFWQAMRKWWSVLGIHCLGIPSRFQSKIRSAVLDNEKALTGPPTQTVAYCTNWSIKYQSKWCK